MPAPSLQSGFLRIIIIFPLKVITRHDDHKDFHPFRSHWSLIDFHGNNSSNHGRLEASSQGAGCACACELVGVQASRGLRFPFLRKASYRTSTFISGGLRWDLGRGNEDG